MWYIIVGICIGVIILLSIKLAQKQKLDYSELNKLTQQLEFARDSLVSTEQRRLRAQVELNNAQDQYHALIQNKTEELKRNFEQQSNEQQARLKELWETKKNNLELKLATLEQSYTEQELKIKNDFEAQESALTAALVDLNSKVNYETERYNGILEPLKILEKERQDKLFYTIQIPLEYHDDIDFLLTTVAAKVQHPDIISKLIWAEYIKPNLDETFKRVGIEAKSGIYKLTNIDSGKAYIGKSTDIKKRIADHFKSTVGIKSIADQYVHHEILKTGLWNWSIEYITYCDKEELSDLEKYYINFFKTQEFGYNRKEGG